MASFTPAKKPKPIEVDEFLGLNESVGDTEVKVGEAIYMRNFRITSNKKLEKRGGHTTYIDETQPTKAVQGLWYGKVLTNMVLIYVCNGNVKQKIMPSGATSTLGTMTDARTRMFYFGSRLYFQNGTEFKYYDGTTFGDVSSIAYVPTIAIGSPPTGGGTLYQEANNLTGKKKQEFVGNNTATAFTLAEAAIDATLLICTVNGVTKTETTDFTVNRTTGIVTFGTAPAASAKVIIQWEKASTSTPALITANRSAMIYGPGNDTTIFIWGDTTQPNRRTFSGTLDPTYWPINNFTLIGSNQYAITDIIGQYDRQIIFKEDQTFYSTPEFISALNKYDYPVFPLNYTIGNVCFDGVQIAQNNPVSLSGHTVWEWINTSVKDERNATDRGGKMPLSFADIDFKTAVTFENQSEKELWINSGDLVYIWNYDLNVWYIFDNITANCFLDIDGVVYYGTKDGKIEVFSGALNDNSVAITAKWKSGFVDFSAYEYYKNSTNLWFAIQPYDRTSVTMVFPTNRINEDDPNIKIFKDGYMLLNFDDVDFDDMSFETNRNPQTFRFKIKAKKYTTIQFVISNNDIQEELVFLGFKISCETTSFAK